MASNFDNYFPFSNNQYEKPPDDPARHQEWIIDSGASGNSTYIGDFLYDIRRINTQRIVCADGGTLSTDTMGEVDIDGKGFLAKNVLYIPSIDSNILSVSNITNDKHVVVFDKNGCEIYNEGDVMVNGFVKARGRITEDGLYKLILSDDNGDGGPLTKNLWHRRLCHIDITEIQLLQNYMSVGITMEDNDRRIECLVPSCFNYFEYSECPSYMTAFNFNSHPKATRSLELVYFYLSASLYEQTLNGNKYYIIFVDDYTRKTFIYFFRTATDIIPTLNMFKQYVETYTGNKIKHMSTGVDISFRKYYPYVEKFTDFNYINLTYRKKIAIIEWFKHTLLFKNLCLMSESNLPTELWAEATGAVVNLLNIFPNTGLPFSTPLEAWSGVKPDLSVMRIFGCKAYLPCLKKYVVHLGYDFEKGLYRFMDTTHYGVYFKRTAIFYEEVPFFKPMKY